MMKRQVEPALSFDPAKGSVNLKKVYQVIAKWGGRFAGLVGASGRSDARSTTLGEPAD
jgi:hypothetical protein